MQQVQVVLITGKGVKAHEEPGSPFWDVRGCCERCSSWLQAWRSGAGQRGCGVFTQRLSGARGWENGASWHTA